MFQRECESRHIQNMQPLACSMVEVGDKAPDFTLKNTVKEEVTISDYRGKTVILAFYPGAFTGVCDKEMCSFQEKLSNLNDCNATVFGISVDSPWANSEFARRYNLEFELLSDLDRKVVELCQRKTRGRHYRQRRDDPVSLGRRKPWSRARLRRNCLLLLCLAPR